MSQFFLPKAARIAAADWTRSNSGSYPSRRKASISSRASSSVSSTSSTSSGWLMSWPLRRGNLVQEQPIQSDLPGGLDELRKTDRFVHIAVAAKAVTVDQVHILLGGGQYDHGQQLGALIGPDSPQ